METKKSLKFNFIMNSILSMSTFIFPLITFPYISRVLEPDGVGKVNFATSLISYFMMVAQLGIPTYGIRACAKVRDDKQKLTKVSQELLLINLIMSTISYLVLIICIMFVPRLQGDRVLYFAVSGNIILSAMGLEWLYKALEQYSYITIRSIIFKLIALIFMFLMVRQKEDYVIYGAISTFAACASNLFNFINAHKYIHFKPIGHYQLGRHMKAIVVFFAMSCATSVYLHLDTVMLGFLASDTDVGYYSTAVKVKMILVSVVTSLGTVLLPRVSYYIQQNKLLEFRRITKKALNFIFILSVPLTIYFILFAKQAVHFLSGSAYDGSIIPMQFIMPTLILIGITNILGIQILVPLGKEKYVLYSEIAGAVINLSLNIMLIPRYQSTGAAIGTLVAEFTVLIVQLYFLRDSDSVKEAFKNIKYYKIGIAILISATGSYLISNFMDVSSNFLALLVTSILFFGIYIILLAVMREKLVIDILNQIMRQKKGRD